MTYLTYALESIHYVANSIYIPIPITPTYVYKFDIFSLFIALVILGLLIYFFSRLLGIGTSMLFTDISDGVRDSFETKRAKNKAQEQQGTYRRRVQGREIYNRRRIQGIMHKSK